MDNWVERYEWQVKQNELLEDDCLRLMKERNTERALADQLAEALAGRIERSDCSMPSEREALAAWEEARREN